MGYTPSLSFGAWVGGDERDIHFASMALGQGANAALPIVAKFLLEVYAHPELGYSPEEKFDIPQGFDPCSSVYGDEDEEVVEMPVSTTLDDMAN